MTDPTSLPDFPPPSHLHPLRGRVLDVLLDEGFRPDIDEDGDVAVKVQGQQLYVRCTEGEVTLLRVFGQWRLGDAVPADELAQLRACNDVSARLSIVKTTVAGGVLVASADHLVGEGSSLVDLVKTSFELVLTAVALWHDTISGGDGEQ